MLLSNYAVCDSKKSKFITQQEASGILSSLETQTPLSKFLQQVLFCLNSTTQVITRYKMNEIVSKVLLAGDKLKTEMHLRQPRFTYGACGPFTKKNEFKN